MNEHETVLASEAVKQLNIVQDGIYIDCTFGRGGHSARILEGLSSTGHLYAFDQDLSAKEYAKKNFLHAKNFTFIHKNFRFLKEEMDKRNIKAVNGILFDLGVSSPQFDDEARGFSYRHDAPLDMRMDQRSETSALNVVNEWEYEQLVSTFFRYGEEKFSKQIARKIEAARQEKPIQTTGELVELIKEAIPAPARRKGGHPAKRVFQAIRIAVNDELKAFEEGLMSGIEMLNENGRIVVITFHSLEDRICKSVFRKESQGPDIPKGLPILPKEYIPKLKLITRKPILPSEEEVEMNRRARSAKMRVAQKQGD